jgi:ABC-type phosphate transport system substrate-binding protein
MVSMKHPIQRWNAMAAIWLLASLLASAIAAAPEERPEPAPRIAVVTHLENETASITRTELARMFRKTQTEWEDGEHCIPIDQAGGDIRTAFGRIVLEQTPDEWKRYWIQQTMTGNARPPIALDSSETVKKYVRKLKGAVAYIYESEVDDTVRVLAITDAPELLAPAQPEESKGRDESDSTAPENEPTPARDGAEAPK